MTAFLWRITFFCLLLIQVGAYAVPTTPLSASHSLPERLSRRETYEYELNKTKYTLEALEEGFQGKSSQVFTIIGGYPDGRKRVPALLKRVSENKTNVYSKARAEIEFLKRDSVDLYLLSQWTDNQDQYTIDIVVKDVTRKHPPYKPFYQWYLEDATMKLLPSLENAAENTENRLLWYAVNENLLYKDFHDQNIYLRKEALTHVTNAKGKAVMPIDWGPADEYAGVEDIAHDANKRDRVKDFMDKMSRELRAYFSVESLYNELERNGHSLRDHDMGTVEYGGEIYDLLYVRHYDGDIDTYKVLDLFEGDALMDRIHISSEESGQNMIDAYSEREDVLGAQIDMDYSLVEIFYRDTR